MPTVGHLLYCQQRSGNEGGSGQYPSAGIQALPLESTPCNQGQKDSEITAGV